MKNELEKLENKSKSLEKQQKQLINSNTINERDLRGKTEDEVIEYLKNRTNKQIESKKKEKNSKITYKETVLEKDNKKNLICKICKKIAMKIVIVCIFYSGNQFLLVVL